MAPPRTPAWQRLPGTPWRVVLDDVVLLADREDEPFVLARGAALWQLLASPATVAELAERLGGGAATDEVAAGITSALEELERRGAARRLWE